MKTMTLCLIIYALIATLLVNQQVNSVPMALTLTLAGAVWALIMYLEADRVPSSDYPQPLPITRESTTDDTEGVQVEEAAEVPRMPEDQVVSKDYYRIAHLIGGVFFAGDFVAETPNERELEALLKKVGCRYTSWEQIGAVSRKLEDTELVSNTAASIGVGNIPTVHTLRWGIQREYMRVQVDHPHVARPEMLHLIQDAVKDYLRTLPRNPYTAIVQCDTYNNKKVDKTIQLQVWLHSQKEADMIYVCIN